MPTVFITTFLTEGNDPPFEQTTISAPDDNAFEPTLIQDPFGLRKAVVPLFLAAGEQFVGAGSAFHVDFWGNLLSADHVISDMRARHRLAASSSGQNVNFKFGPDDWHSYVINGVGLVFGTVGLPPGAISLVRSVYSEVVDRDDPIAQMRGERVVQAAADLAYLRVTEPPPKMVGTIPIRLSGWRPRRGEWVCALGYPELDAKRSVSRENVVTLSERMHYAFGQIADAHPTGRGTDTNPVVEVRCNWPSGMSGGPVFNQAGEVVGVVSRSLAAAEGEDAGTGVFTALQLIPRIDTRFPTVDPINPIRREGWAVFEAESGRLLGFYESETHARTALPTDSGYEVRFGSVVPGTDEFISGSSRHGVGPRQFPWADDA